jgi:hypothetical protein
MSSFLQVISEGSNDQIATEAGRRFGAMQLPPGKPQIVRRLIEEFGNFRRRQWSDPAFVLGRSDCRCGREPVTARQRAGEPKRC